MISGVELSKSDRANCRGCRKTIGKGVPRGYKVDESHQGGHINFCYNCSFILIDSQIELLKDTKKELKKLIKENKEIITKTEIMDNLEEKGK